MTENPLIRPQKLWYAVAEYLRSEIANGNLAPGDTLTLEAELLKQFKVSRPILREALRVLESEGLISLGRGSRRGATVLAPSIGTAAKLGGLYLFRQGTSVGEVHQVRTLIEPSMVAKLAQNASEECIQALQQCVDEQAASIEAKDHVAAVSALDDLHGLMIQYTDNRALSLLAGMLGNMPAMAFRQLLLVGTSATRRAFRRNTEKSVDAHGQLVKLIATGKSAQAEKFWRSYMEDTAKFLSSNGLAVLPIQISAQP
jgi:DNA-binding FadR family transcriptional regulator